MVTICTASLTFNNSTFCPHSVFMCSVWNWEQTATISLYSINWLVFITEIQCLLCGTDWIYVLCMLTLQSPVVTICTTSLTFNNSTFCPHNVFMCFVWIWEQIAIISLNSNDWLVFITETECLRRGADWSFYIYVTYTNSRLQITADCITNGVSSITSCKNTHPQFGNSFGSEHEGQ